MPKISIKNFSMPNVLISAYGTLNDNGVEINTSSILTKLIQICGTNCRSYASDLFIDWQSLAERLKNPAYHGEKMLFGIRENGVDHADFIFSRIEGLTNCDDISNIYCGGIWFLDIIVDKNECFYGHKSVRMFFGKAKLNINNT
jgi:hypothetical protein